LCAPDPLTDWASGGARHSGLALWLRNPVELRAFAERLAKAQYNRQRNPRDCMTLYLALGRKNIVLALMKVSVDPECKKIWTFLSRDFEQHEHKVAALKNAYVIVPLFSVDFDDPPSIG
jgi:hypothetical protein